MRDVIIIGAGPSGSHLAGRLAREGLDVLLLEEHEAVGDEVICSGIIGREAYDRFELPQGAEVGFLKEIRFFSPSGRVLDFKPEETLATIVSRRKFDAMVADRAVRHGAELWTASRADDVTTGKTSVRIRIRRQDREQALEARLCVVATGYGSSLVRQLGFKDHSRLIQGAQTIMEGNYGSPARIFLGSKLAPKGFGWSVPVGGGRSRIGVVSFRRAPFYLRRILNRFLEEEGGSGEALPRIQVSPIPFGALESTVMDRVMVIGEAAGQVKTTTQGGIYYGLLSAEAAAETTVEAFRNGNLSREALRPYENRWRSRLEKELEMGTIFREFFSELSDRQLDRLFDIARIDGVLPLIQKKARFDWHAPIIQSFLTNGFLGSIVRSALGLCPLKTRVL